MGGGVGILGDGLTGFSQGHLTKSRVCLLHRDTILLSKLLISAKFGRVKQAWVVSILVGEHGVHALCRNRVVTNFNILVLVLLITGLESAKIIHQNFSISFLMSSIFIIIPIHSNLTRFHHRVRFVAIRLVTTVASYVVNHYNLFQ